VEYALRGVRKHIGVAEWQTKLEESLPKKFPVPQSAGAAPPAHPVAGPSETVNLTGVGVGITFPSCPPSPNRKTSPNR
jgi:hypothetical protein